MERIAGRIVLLWGWRRYLTAAAAGAIAVLAQAPFDFMAVCFISFPVLVWLLDGATADSGSGILRRLAPAFATGWWFGLGYFVAGLWWVGNALLVEAESFAWALPLAVFLLPAALALFYGLATALARLFWDHELGRIAALAAAFGFAEWLRSFLFTGFPWNAIGYAIMPIPLLMQPVAAVGLHVMNMLAVFVFAMPALLAARRHLGVGVASALVIAAACGGYGLWRMSLPLPDGESISVRIVQASIDQAGKWDRQVRDDIFRKYLALSAGTPEGEESDFRPRLIVWPETSVPFLFEERPDALLAIGQLLDDDQMLLAGAVRTEGDANAGRLFYNSIVAINADGVIEAAADKVHLVPFGEYLPLSGLLESFGLRRLVTAPGMFSAAAERRLIRLDPNLALLPLICYEIIFPDEVTASASGAHMIVNITNDAWYGNTPGPYQHLRQAQVRAVETGLPLIRAANNGVSAAVDARGRILDALDIDEIGNIDVRLAAGSLPIMPYHRHYFVGVLLLFLFSAAILHYSSRIQAN